MRDSNYWHWLAGMMFGLCAAFTGAAIAERHWGIAIVDAALGIVFFFADYLIKPTETNK